MRGSLLNNGDVGVISQADRAPSRLRPAPPRAEGLPWSEEDAQLVSIRYQPRAPACASCTPEQAWYLRPSQVRVSAEQSVAAVAGALLSRTTLPHTGARAAAPPAYSLSFSVNSSGEAAPTNVLFNYFAISVKQWFSIVIGNFDVIMAFYLINFLATRILLLLRWIFWRLYGCLKRRVTESISD